MSMQVTLRVEGDPAAIGRRHLLRLRAGTVAAAARFAALAKERYRAAVRAAGLGDRLANAVRVTLYRDTPAVLVHSRARAVLAAHARGAVIAGRGGQWLAIPTANVPRRRRRRATMREVEIMFGALRVLAAGDRLLAFANVVRGRRGLRRRSRRRRAAGRRGEWLLMFVLVRRVTLARRLRWDETTAALEREFRALLAAAVTRGAA